MKYERIENFDIKKLDMNDETFQARQDYDEKKIENLSKDIKKYGQREPIGIRISPKKKGSHQIIFGFQRVKAIMNLKKKNIEAYLYTGLSDRDCQELAVRDNEMHGDLTEMEKALQCYSLKENSWSIEELCESFNTKKSTIYNWLKIAKCDDWLHGLVDYAYLTPYHILEFMKFKDEKERMDLVEEVLQYKWSVRDLKARLKGNPPTVMLYLGGWINICPKTVSMVGGADCEKCEYHLVTVRKKDEEHSLPDWEVYDRTFFCTLPDKKHPQGTMKFWKRYKELNVSDGWAKNLPNAKKFDEKDVRKKLGNRKVLSVDEWVEISRRLEKP